MNFFLTSYIYPIEKPITLSQKLNFVLDNPRTQEEIDLIVENIRVSKNPPQNREVLSL